MRTLLVVDDDADARSLIAEVLSTEGYRLRFAADGREALAMLAEHPLPDAILLDLSMPNMTGWQFRDLQKRQSDLAHIPVLVMTGSSPLGIDAMKVLEKPVSIPDLVHWVRRLAAA